ncbi:MAG TPA: 3-ketoacyl-ACP reductase [Chloroflexi bacterium]|nr:3-ketoacyl-ACP reductase [Chloroflexota bacterium]
MRPVAMITGGTRGIGLGIAQSLAAAGYDLLLCGRRAETEVENTLADLRRYNVSVKYVQADISQTDDRHSLVEAGKSTYQRLNVLVNNAGVAPRERTDILALKEDDFGQMLQVNLQGGFFLTQLAAQWMIEKRQVDAGFHGKVINISSISASVASVNRAAYCIAKAGVSMATRLWAVRLAEFGIDVYEVRPGIIKTDMTAAVQEKYDRLIADGLLLEDRWGTPEDVGKAVCALATGQLPYATGQVLVLDGGLTLPRL